MGFSRQEYWSGLPCPPPGNLPHAGIKPTSLTSSALTGGLFSTSSTWEASEAPINTCLSTTTPASRWYVLETYSCHDLPPPSQLAPQPATLTSFVQAGASYDGFLFSRISPCDLKWHGNEAGFLKLSTNVGPVWFGFVSLLINFNPSWMDTFGKYNKNDLLEKMK